MRAGILIVLTGMALILGGCASYDHVSQGWQGATSPAESGQHGAMANQAPGAGGSEEKGKPEHKGEPAKEATPQAR